tara:strand:+ start:126 stop:464 length:339 start_codon:yes stop_codon:yes gene_type:complete
MFKLKFLFSMLIFSLLLIGTSLIKNQSRELEKNIYSLSELINQYEKDLNESQLDFTYLTTPSMIEKKINFLDKIQYFPMDYSNIYLDVSELKNFQNKFAIQEQQNEKKIKKK